MTHDFDIDDLRDRLKKIRRNNPMSLNKLAKEIGIGTQTLETFLNEQRDTAYTVICKIEDYILLREGKNAAE